MPPRRRGPGIFQQLGRAVMGPMANRQWDPNTYYTPNPSAAPQPAYAPLPAGIPPPPPPAARPRAADAKDEKEGREEKGHADAPEPSQKGNRKSYIPQWGNWLNRHELKAKIAEIEAEQNSEAARLRYSDEKLNQLRKDQKLNRFSLLKQYKFSKHEAPPDYAPGQFGIFGSDGKASKFYNGYYPDTKGWRSLSPAEKEQYMANDDALREPRRAQRQVERNEIQVQEAARERERAVQRQAEQNQIAAREQERLAQQQIQEWNNMPPAEREQVIYNRRLEEYNQQQQRNEYQNQMRFMQGNQQEPQFGDGNMRNQNFSVPQPVMHELFAMSQDQPTRYVPVRPRQSINNRVMSSFDENMFSPEFIPEDY